MIELRGIDAAVLVAYFVGITAFGAMFGRFTTSTRDFFLAGQRFPAWLVSFSCVATLVGSYSFVKYSAVGYSHGIPSTQTYLNDWFWMPLWMLGWLPIIYFGGITSVPEYFARRFGPATRVAATVVLLLYLVGYIGINLYTIGVALETLLRSVVGFDALTLAIIVAALCMVYEMTGGQTSVIFTDLLQGVLLLVAGLTVFFLGIAHVGGLDAFWSKLPDGHGRALPPFNDDPSFNFIGIFWQDGMAGGVAFYFMNQAMLMRFLSARSVNTARRAGGFVLLVLMPLAAVSVAGAGWIGSAMTTGGELPPDTNPKDVFLVVADLLCGPGLFGLVVAAMLAALMSTADTLINASSAVMVNDVYRPLRKGRSEAHYLRAARVTSLLAAAAGVALVPVFQGFESIYAAHGAFTAAITPPMASAILLAFLWPRFTPAGALATLIGGTALMFVSLEYSDLVAPFSHGVSATADGQVDFKFTRACFGVAVSFALGVGVTLLTRRPDADAIKGLTIWTVRQRASTSQLARQRSAKVKTTATRAPATGGSPTTVHLGAAARARLAVEPGDTVFVDDARAWLGGLRSVRGVVAEGEAEGLILPADAMERNGWRDGQAVVIERVD